jgi:lipopolysaccharide transport system ATP-binding protein
MSSEVVLKVENIGKRYEIYEAPHHRLLQTLLRGRKQFYKEFWALKDVSFEVKKGETVSCDGLRPLHGRKYSCNS